MEEVAAQSRESLAQVTYGKQDHTPTQMLRFLNEFKHHIHHILCLPRKMSSHEIQ